MGTRQYNTLQRVVCAYDFVALLPLAVPFLTHIQLETLGQVNKRLEVVEMPWFLLDQSLRFACQRTASFGTDISSLLEVVA